MSRHTTQAGPGSEFFTQVRQVFAPVAFESLVAWYPFRQGDGSDATAGISAFGDTTDYSATVNGPRFKPSGGVTDIQTGANSGAFDLDGTDDTLDLGTVADSNQNLTFMTWVKPDTVTKDFQRFITKIDNNNLSVNGSISLRTSDGGQSDIALVLFKDSSTFTTIFDTTPLSANSYAHIAVRYDFQSGDATLFRDGQSVSTKSVGQLAPYSSQPWRIGEDNPPSGSGFLDGTVDGTRIYQAALSDSQINQIYLNTEP